MKVVIKRSSVLRPNCNAHTNIKKSHKTSIEIFNAGFVVFMPTEKSTDLEIINRIDIVNRFVHTVSQLYLKMAKSFTNHSNSLYQ